MGSCSHFPWRSYAQLLLLPSCHSKFPVNDKERGNRGFGSTGATSIYYSMDLDERPLLVLQVEGKAMLDTGADRSIISVKDWPSAWPRQQSEQTLRGLGYAQMPEVSSCWLTWKDQEGHSGCFQPYVLPVPISLWGRDLMQEMGYKLTNELHYSQQAQQIM